MPSDDPSQLGRILPVPPEPGRALEELSSPNPCAEFLGPPTESAMVNHFEDAVELSVGVKAQALLSSFGFAGDFQRATHLTYRVNTERRLSRLDTTEYERCCTENACGFGHVAALVYGDGNYASAEETSASANVEFTVVTSEGAVQLKELHRRQVRGWVAAVIKAHAGGLTSNIGAFGRGTVAGIEEESIPTQAKAIYEAGKITVRQDGASTFSFWSGANQAITEREFARRYRTVMDSDELDALDSSWASGAVIGLGVPALAFAGMATWGFFNTDRPCEQDDYQNDEQCEYRDTGRYDASGRVGSSLGIAAAIVGTLGALGFGGGALGAHFSGREGDLDEHRLSEYEARVFADRYNRELLRRALRDLDTEQSSVSPPRLVPLELGDGGLGLEWRF